MTCEHTPYRTSKKSNNSNNPSLSSFSSYSIFDKGITNPLKEQQHESRHPRDQSREAPDEFLEAMQSSLQGLVNASSGVLLAHVDAATQQGLVFQINEGQSNVRH